MLTFIGNYLSLLEYYVFFFFKQKTAYEIETWLEFRRVLFRSRYRAAELGKFSNYFILLDKVIVITAVKFRLQ